MTNEELIRELKKLNPKSNVYSYNPRGEGEEEFKSLLIVETVEMDNKDKDIILLPSPLVIYAMRHSVKIS